MEDVDGGGEPAGTMEAVALEQAEDLNGLGRSPRQRRLLAMGGELTVLREGRKGLGLDALHRPVRGVVHPSEESRRSAR